MYADVYLKCDNHGRVTDLSIDLADDISTKIPLALANLTTLQTLKLQSMPHLHGSIPASAICGLTNLWSLTIAYTNMSGLIPDCLGHLNKLTQINLIKTGLTGKIPPFLAQLPNLQQLDLMFNKLHGPIPDFLANMNGIYSISLYSNNFCGLIPASLGQLWNLSMLSLGHNRLIGQIPPSVGLLSSLLWLDLSSNQLSGSIPESFGSLTDSIYLQIQGNHLTGPVPQSLGRVDTTWLDLSNNRLIGDASFLFARKKYWTEKIVLSNNLFRFNFSNVELPQHLSTMNISHNNIYGFLPKELAQLWSIDVSWNELCGAIPAGCEKFGVSAFAENKCLCGTPITACK